ncbi:MAG TPA: hypothetical protein DEG71_11500 [Clostridiales bacterium]|nr:hypothetical protein [Clostridiales bacterium]
MENDDSDIATDLYKKIYEVLSYAAGNYIFASQDPFWAIGTQQTILIDKVIARKFKNGVHEAVVREMVLLVLESNVDRETLDSYLIDELIENLKTVDSKMMAIEESKKMIKEVDKEKIDRYYREEKNNKLAELILKLYIELCEYEKGIQYFNESYVERDKEITLYVLLRILFVLDLDEWWVYAYDLAVKKGVKPRERLQKMYEFVKENGKLPEHM